MSIDDEIKREQERILAQRSEEERQKAFEDECEKNGFNIYSLSTLCLSEGKFHSTVNGLIPHLNFDNPKIIRVFSDKNVYVRCAGKDEIPDTYSFDICYDSRLGNSIWIFNNGMFALNGPKPQYGIDSVADKIKKQSFMSLL